jgi:hypothetical protein
MGQTRHRTTKCMNKTRRAYKVLNGNPERKKFTGDLDVD